MEYAPGRERVPGALPVTDWLTDAVGGNDVRGGTEEIETAADDALRWSAAIAGGLEWCC